MANSRPKPWHDYRTDLSALLASGNRAGFDAKLREALNGPTIDNRRSRVWIAETNKSGDAYSSMGATDMAIQLLNAAAKWKNPEYLVLMHCVLRPVITNRKRGGLIWRTSGKTNWLHSRTDWDSDVRGGTLNQALLSTRDLLRIGTFGAGKWPKYISAGHKFLAQLWSNNEGPNYKNFIPKHGNGTRIRDSWIYYAVDVREASFPGYFLSANDDKNATYHILIMRLLRELRNLYPGAPWYDLREFVALLTDPYNRKLATGHPHIDDPSDGDFSAINPDKTPLLSNSERKWFGDNS